MTAPTRRSLLAAGTALALALIGTPAFSADVTITIGYQPIVEPSRVPAGGRNL